MADGDGIPWISRPRDFEHVAHMGHAQSDTVPVQAARKGKVTRRNQGQPSQSEKPSPPLRPGVGGPVPPPPPPRPRLPGPRDDTETLVKTVHENQSADESLQLSTIIDTIRKEVITTIRHELRSVHQGTLCAACQNNMTKSVVPHDTPRRLSSVEESDDNPGEEGIPSASTFCKTDRRRSCSLPDLWTALNVPGSEGPSDQAVTQASARRHVYSAGNKDRIERFLPGRRVHRSTKDHQRDCLARAIQENAAEFTDLLQFQAGDLTDILQQEEYMTANECSNIRNMKIPADQVRKLLGIVHGRDYCVLEKFLDCASRENPNLKVRVMEAYEKNMQKCPTMIKCGFCKMKEGVDIKHVVDSLWSISAISPGLYLEIASCEKQAGFQDNLWKVLASQCNASSAQHRVWNRLIEAIASRGHYSHIVEGLTNQAQQRQPFECTCGTGMAILPNHPSSGRETWSSISPVESESDARPSSIDSILSDPDLASVQETSKGQTDEDKLESLQYASNVSLFEPSPNRRRDGVCGPFLPPPGEMGC